MPEAHIGTGIMLFSSAGLILMKTDFNRVETGPEPTLKSDPAPQKKRKKNTELLANITYFLKYHVFAPSSLLPVNF